MEIVFKAEEGKEYHRCNVCGNVDVWNENWTYRFIPIGEGYSAYELDFITCSKECDDKAEPIMKKIKKQKEK